MSAPEKGKDASANRKKAPEKSTSAKHSVVSLRAFGASFMVALIAVVLLWKFGPSGGPPSRAQTKIPSAIPDHDRFALRHYNFVGQVPVVQWEPSKPFARDVILVRTIFSHSAVLFI